MYNIEMDDKIELEELNSNTESNFIKEKHIELSEEDTYIVSNDKCPLTEEEAENLNVTIYIDGKSIPCCKCRALIEGTTQIDSQCPYYFGYILYAEKESFKELFDCRNQNKNK